MGIGDLEKGFGSTWYGKFKPKVFAGETAKAVMANEYQGQTVVLDESLPPNVVRFVATVDNDHNGEVYDVTVD